MNKLAAAIVATLALANQIATGQGEPIPAGPRQEAAPRGESEDDRRAKLLGVLVYSKVTMKLEETPVREVIDALAQELGIRIVGRYSDDAVGFGLDPDAQVSIDAVNQDALSVLEEILEQCAAYDECTWQLRKGLVEVSTKERLSVPGSREVRTYHIRDLMLEAPYFDDAAVVGFSLNGNWGPGVAHNCGSIDRKRPEDLSLEILAAVIEVVEAGMWAVGTDSRLKLEELGYVFPTPPLTVPPSTAAPGAPAAGPAPAMNSGTWGSIRIWRDQLIVRAPDFMHRQIGGYPKPIPPAPAEAEEASSPTAGSPPAASPPEPAKPADGKPKS